MGQMELVPIINKVNNLYTDNPFHNATLTVDNCFGQTVAQIKNLRGQTISFNRDNLTSGLYFYKVTGDKGQGRSLQQANL